MRLTKGWDTNELRCISTECIYEGVDASAPIIIGAFMYFECLVSQRLFYGKVTKKIIRWFADAEHAFVWLNLEGYNVHFLKQIGV